MAVEIYSQPLIEGDREAAELVGACGFSAVSDSSWNVGGTAKTPTPQLSRKGA
jgi:hypothetical protein